MRSLGNRGSLAGQGIAGSVLLQPGKRAAGMSEPKSVNVDAFDGDEDGGIDDV